MPEPEQTGRVLDLMAALEESVSKAKASRGARAAEEKSSAKKATSKKQPAKKATSKKTSTRKP
ncbi:hypothetical protein [Streptomyces sp. NPDC006334]|uniref:hypothetical protein n=1 Tax=Streptomyces sp. NPDC006334 TaxID=3156754 RepID=UPI0033A714AE